MSTPQLFSFLVIAIVGSGAVAQAPTSPLMPAPSPSLPRYALEVRLDIAAGKVRTRQRVTWTNTATRETRQLVFNAHAHYKVADDQIGLLAKTLEILRMNADEGIYTSRRPLEVHTIEHACQQLPFRFEGDSVTDLVVDLPHALGKGDSIEIELDFTLHLPKKQGRWGQWEGVTQLSNWVPMVAIHDEDGWHPTPFIPWHQPFYNEAGVFHARIVLPADQKVATTGTIDVVRPLEDGLQEVCIRALGVRDFAFLCSARYVEYTAEARTIPGMPSVRVRVVAFPEHEHYARLMLKVICEVIPYYSQWIGPYPWNDFTIAESFFGWNGNECATLVMIDERVFAMPHIGSGYVEYLIAHEVCHQWWYNLIGTNGFCETWMDEAMATFFAHKFLDLRNGRNSKMISYPRGLEWLPNIPRESYRYSTFYGVAGRGELGPTVQDIPKYGHIGNLFGICYDKGAKIVALIESRLGEAAFLDFMRRLYTRYSFGILRVSSFRHELEDYTGQSWEEFFQRWLYGSGICDWAVESVTVEPLSGPPRPRWAASFFHALQGRGPRPCRVTVMLRQKGDYDEQTTLGISLSGGETEDGRTPFQIRLPILPQSSVVQHDDPPSRIERLPDGRFQVVVELPCEPQQIAVDPDQLLVDGNPANNWWKQRIRWRFAPLYTLLEDSDLTTAYDRWNATAGLWLNGAAYIDPWYQRSTVVGLRGGLYRSHTFSGGGYVGYRTTFRDLVVGGDGVWDHWPWPRTQVGFNVERRLETWLDGDAHPHRAAVFGRYVFQYNSSLYLPPIHHVEAFATVQENPLPYVRHMVPGSRRYDGVGLAGIHYHLNYLTPYWDPRGGVALDLTYAGGIVDLDKQRGAQQIQGQFSAVKALPDLSEHVDESTWPGKIAGPVLRYLGDTRLAVRAYGAAGLPERAQYFPLGGDMLFRGFTIAERQGSLVWLGSLELRFPLLRQIHWDAVDHVASARNLSGALFYDVGDVYSRGHSFGPVPHALGAGLRLDVTWFGFVERVTLRLDVAKTINVDTPLQVMFGANMPF